MVNQCKRELEYWNAEMRNPFLKKEIQVGLDRDISSDGKSRLLCFITIEDEVLKNEFRQNIESIISSIFDETKADILRLYINKDMRPRDIAMIKGLAYQNTYSIITRGMKKISEEYKKRYSLDIVNNL
jgi:DNA-directed RNA polymerase specialized sigma24 family protein